MTITRSCFFFFLSSFFIVSRALRVLVYKRTCARSSRSQLAGRARVGNGARKKFYASAAYPVDACLRIPEKKRHRRAGGVGALGARAARQFSENEERGLLEGASERLGTCAKGGAASVASSCRRSSERRAVVNTRTYMRTQREHQVLAPPSPTPLGLARARPEKSLRAVYSFIPEISTICAHLLPRLARIRPFGLFFFFFQARRRAMQDEQSARARPFLRLIFDVHLLPLSLYLRARAAAMPAARPGMRPPHFSAFSSASVRTQCSRGRGSSQFICN